MKLKRMKPVTIFFTLNFVLCYGENVLNCEDEKDTEESMMIEIVYSKYY